MQVIRGPSETPVPRGTISSTVVTIRDGDTPFSNLLLALPIPYDATADGTRTTKGVVTSTGNQLRVEYRVDVSSSTDERDNFVAAYYTVIGIKYTVPLCMTVSSCRERERDRERVYLEFIGSHFEFDNDTHQLPLPNLVDMQTKCTARSPTYLH